MKKIYENVELEVLFFAEEDVIRTSNNDNTAEMPEFPEDFGQ
jgi:hypothetical protein